MWRSDQPVGLVVSWWPLGRAWGYPMCVDRLYGTRWISNRCALARAKRGDRESLNLRSVSVASQSGGVALFRNLLVFRA